MKRVAFALIVLMGLAAPAWAQTTGSISGTVTDTSGAVLPGVRVTAAGTSVGVGASVSVTNEKGEYRFPSVPPGTYTLKFELASFGTVNREGIIVSINFNAAVNVQLAIAAMQEMITVSGSSPVVDTTNTNIQTNISQQVLKDIPNARDIWSVIGQAPGMMVTSFDVGGNRAGTQTGYSAFGYGGQVRVMVDGVNTTEGTGAAGFYYDYGAFEELQIGSDGNDASAATPGVQLSAIIKSGTNRLKGDMYYDYENEDFQGRNVTIELRRLGVGEGQRILLYRDPNFSVGGPIVKDKFWFFTSIRDQRTGVTVDGFPVENPGRFFFETRLTNISYKLTYQLSQNNRLSHYIQWGRKLQPHRGAGSAAYLDAVFRQDSWSWAGNLEWNSVVSPRFVFNTRYANFGYDWPNLGYGVNGELGSNFRQRRSENATGNSAGRTNEDQNDRKRHQFDWTGTLFVDNFLQGDHALKFGVVNEWETQKYTDYGFVDHVSLTFNSAAGSPDFTTPFRVTIRNTPRENINSTWHHGAFITDQWKITPKITANVGARVDYYTSYYPDQQILEGPYRAYFYAGGVLSNGHSVAPTAFGSTFSVPKTTGFRTHTSVAPRIGVAYNIDGGKTVLKANWGRFYFNTGLAAAGVNPAQSLTATFDWIDRNGDKNFTPDELGTFRSSTGGVLNRIDPNIKHTYTDSTSVFLERELMPDFGARIGYTYRSDGNNAQAVELARLYSLYTGQVLVNDDGPDGLAGTADDGPPFIVYDIPSPVPGSVTETRTVDGFLVIDRAVDVTLTKRMRNRWSLSTNFLYNWDRDRGVPQTPNQERFNDSEVTLWAFKLVGTYQGPWGVVISPSLRHQAGDPLSRNVTATRGVDQATGLTRNLNLGITYQGEGPGSYREDNITIFDARFEKRFNFDRHQVGVFFDMFNINNTNASQSADSVIGRRTVTVDGELVNYQRFLRPTGVLPPRIYRFGFRYSF